MANLWRESQISADILFRQVTCIAFGQPFMKIELIDTVLRISPDLKKSIHSVLLKEDLFPQIMGYVSMADYRRQIDVRKRQHEPEQVFNSIYYVDMHLYNIITFSGKCI